MKIIGYDSFIMLLKSVYVIKSLGIPAHIIVISPPGTAKTTTSKLFAQSVSARFVRTTGRYDILPEDFIAEKEIEYVDGKPTIVWKLRAVGKLLEKDNPQPAIWFFDEFDKMNRKSMFALLELMEEQQVTLPDGATHKLNFMLIASGNSRKYDKDATPIPRSVRDRFIAFWELGYLPIDQELLVLDESLKYIMGDRAPDTEQFNPLKLRVEREKFNHILQLARRTYGECFIKAVASMRTSEEIEEPPGPRAYIHATVLTAGLAAVGLPLDAAAELAFKAAVAGKITVSMDTNPFTVCEEAFITYCKHAQRSQKTTSQSQEFFRNQTSRDRRVREDSAEW